MMKWFNRWRYRNYHGRTLVTPINARNLEYEQAEAQMYQKQAEAVNKQWAIIANSNQGLLGLAGLMNNNQTARFQNIQQAQQATNTYGSILGGLLGTRLF